MNSSTSKKSELPQPQQQQLLQISQHDKFYSRLLSKESSISNPSSRVYYGGASGAVPFVWESHPGTPKRRTATANPLPPLTPPPSYHLINHPKNKKKKASSKSNLVQCILARTKKTPTTSTSTQLASPSVSLSSTSSSGSSRAEAEAEDEDSSVEGGSPTSTLRGCYSMLAMKNVLLSIVGASHGSS